MKCPICSIDLAMTHRDGVEIDYCSKCRGVWLDRGELDKLIELSTAKMASSDAAFTDRHRRESGYDKHVKQPKKRESWLSQLMDFD